MTYAIMSDLHLHGWQAFAGVGPKGLNSRLEILLGEMLRGAEELRERGGKKLCVTGDVFHVRGSIAPSVLNPALDTFRSIVDMGIEVLLIPGNHDLEGKSSDRLSSAVTALEGVGVKVIHEPKVVDGIDNIVFVPWVEKTEDLKAILEGYRHPAHRENTDLLLHAPIDGVIAGLPDHGLTADYLASLGFRRVFAGHYHHHHDFGNGVYSVGALAHHTFSDIKSKAGFLIVGDGFVEWRASHAPSFVDIADCKDEAEVELLVEGNYVRARVTDATNKEVNELREWLTGAGARGVVIQQVKSSVRERDGKIAASVSAGASLETSIADYVKTQGFARQAELQVLCQKILADVEVA